MRLIRSFQSTPLYSEDSDSHKGLSGNNRQILPLNDVTAQFLL